MAQEPTPQDPKLRPLVERLEKDINGLTTDKDVAKLVERLKYDWRELKEFFNYTWNFKSK